MKKNQPLRRGDRARKPARSAAILGRHNARAGAVVPRRWTWHYQTLMGLRERLLGERRELVRNAAEPIEPHSMNIADTASDEFDRDLALRQLSADQDALYEVNMAIERILAGTYGLCDETGKRIPAARLKAVPWTRFAKQVEERMERRGTVHRSQLGTLASVRGPRGTRLEEAEQPEAGVTETPPKDEALREVFSPPGRHQHPAARAKSPAKRTRRIKRKGRAK
jgi:RNA polymerase-binding transcription factor DksA